MPISLETFALLLPEGIVIVGGICLLIGGAFFGPRRGWVILALTFLILAAWCFARSLSGGPTTSEMPREFAEGPLQFDSITIFFRGLSLVIGGLLVMAMGGQTAARVATEQVGLLLLSIAGLMLAAGAGDFILLFIGLELVTFPTYVIVLLGNRGRPSREAAVKYFYLSIFASALFLFGVAHLYGATGTLSLRPGMELANASGATSLAALEMLALSLILAGVAFKLAAAPFHFYAPDVYQDASNGAAGLLAVIPKIIGIIVVVRILGMAISLPGMAEGAWQWIIILSMVSMTLGNVCALWQENVRRLMAYSSIAHAGYMLMGVAAALASNGSADGMAVDGIGATLFYLAVYSAATLGIFAVLTHLGSGNQDVDKVSQLRGLGRTHPISMLILIVCLFSLAGIPPLAGFWGKFGLFASSLGMLGEGESLFHSAASRWFVALAVVAAINAAIAAAYYLRIIALICFYPPTASLQGKGGIFPLLSGAACAALVLVSGILPGPLFHRSQQAGGSAWERGEITPSEREDIRQVGSEDVQKKSHG